MAHLSQGPFRLTGSISSPVAANLDKSQADISPALLCLLQNWDFKLEFGHHQGRTSSVWHGGTATIVQSPGDEVWGIVWKMNASNLSSLDKQEGVEDGIYVPIEVNVHTEAGKVLTCRSYQMKDYVRGPPSPQYKKVICMGAKQNGLPTDYQKKLEAIETNNYAGPVLIMEEIEAAIETKKINSA
ncbi:PREDICTED: gamma-glutamylcyclotransferase [Leptosomus discolor]|uniref:gamma-glutamylcyclotransferase n=1 Tax=Leptosomus discolor TaxID=188344 RepID=UPI000522A3BC|nr:PREDICTED: gamma-glutamylcyclotransferase [Leptosomus discolor]